MDDTSIQVFNNERFGHMRASLRRDRIIERILTVGDGAMLPSVRALAADAGVNPLTVAKAYQMFQEQLGLSAQSVANGSQTTNTHTAAWMRNR